MYVTKLLHFLFFLPGRRGSFANERSRSLRHAAQLLSCWWWWSDDADDDGNDCYKLLSGASTQYTRWNRCTMEKLGEGFCWNFRGSALINSLLFVALAALLLFWRCCHWSDIRPTLHWGYIVLMIFATRCQIIKAKVHQIWFRLGLYLPQTHWGSLQCSPRSPSWI